MDQHFEYVKCVEDAGQFIRANLDSKPSGLRMLLKDMLESTMLRVVELKLNLIRYNTHTNAVRS